MIDWRQWVCFVSNIGLRIDRPPPSPQVFYGTLIYLYYAFLCYVAVCILIMQTVECELLWLISLRREILSVLKRPLLKKGNTLYMNSW
jgi:hypothetical protein